jgi:transposase-like protein
MELLTLKPLRHDDTMDLEVVALDDSGVTVTYTVQLTKDLSDILSVSPDERSPMTSDLIDFVRAEARAYLKANGAELARMTE